MAMQFKVDYDTEKEQPELIISYDADATKLEEKLFERFLELLDDPTKRAVYSTSVSVGVKRVKIGINNHLAPVH